MLMIGSGALSHHFPEAGFIPRDTDYICTLEEFRAWTKCFVKGEIILCKPLSADKIHVRTKDGWNYEFEIATPGSTAQELLDYFDINDRVTMAPPHVLLALKLSHRYRRNSPHFLKTMRDIQFLRAQGVELGTELEEWLPKREAATYTYAHPKLDVSKEAFFDGDGVDYVYDHDDLHKILAVDGAPAYTKYMAEGSQVLTSKAKFFAVDHRVRVLGGLEEALVLACERSQIPFPEVNPDQSFTYALMKVCTSITSGYFREFCWEHYDEIVEEYNKNGGSQYATRIREAIQNGEIIPRSM